MCYLRGSTRQMLFQVLPKHHEGEQHALYVTLGAERSSVRDLMQTTCNSGT